MCFWTHWPFIGGGKFVIQAKDAEAGAPVWTPPSILPDNLHVQLEEADLSSSVSLNGPGGDDDEEVDGAAQEGGED